ncbi:MAG TPA: methyltransferase [Phenylobacterium sp.]|uniref:class I SAM-dependent methyltransferase n=1 Tax=Phenylobacterium sp. TaxID=1871053 RepID=UPI002C2F9280|nr:methyltransferase [Phenylobacterium sp.]HSV02990.1 methyltransferase [Phenylobacterium sp.]
MNKLNGTAFAIGLALMCAAPVAVTYAQQPPAPADALTDPALKAKEVIAFIGLKPGETVADIVAGRFVRAESQAVGPKGKVYAVMPAEVVKAHPEVVGLLKTTASQPAYANVVVSTPPIDHMDLPKGLDAVFIRQNYHDLHDKFMGPADVPAFNRAVYAALKPGGVFVVLDHAAPGTGLSATETLHRIDPAAVKSEVEAAGFKFDGSSDVLANPADDHTKTVFNPAIRGKTDQFLFRFRKPR